MSLQIHSTQTAQLILLQFLSRVPEEAGRPLWRWIAKDDNYTRKYHDALDKLVTDYFESGRFEREVSDLSEMLRPYVEKDPTAFFSADEYKKGCVFLLIQIRLMTVLW